jgi:L-lactate dehydrogenase complex protein LldG
MPDNARAAILKRIRAANRAETTIPSAHNAWSLIQRDYRRHSTIPRESVLALFAERLRDYDALVERTTASDAASAVAKAVTASDNGRMLVAAGFPAKWLPEGAAFTPDSKFSPEELDRFAGVITSATLGIAETGTFVLQNVPGQGRRAATLVPDTHICVIRAADVVETVPEAIAMLARTAHLPTTFVSGPSATADIEMTRIKGVHGPRFLHVVLID